MKITVDSTLSLAQEGEVREGGVEEAGVPEGEGQRGQLPGLHVRLLRPGGGTLQR